MKKIVALLIAIASCAVICGMNAGMAYGAAARVTLKTDQTKAYSGWTRDLYCNVWGKNEVSSKHTVFYTAQYQVPGDKVRTDKNFSVNPGTYLDFVETNQHGSSDTNWRLMLDVRLLYSECSAWGAID